MGRSHSSKPDCEREVKKNLDEKPVLEVKDENLCDENCNENCDDRYHRRHHRHRRHETQNYDSLDCNFPEVNHENSDAENYNFDSCDGKYNEKNITNYDNRDNDELHDEKHCGYNDKGDDDNKSYNKNYEEKFGGKHKEDYNGKNEKDCSEKDSYEKNLRLLNLLFYVLKSKGENYDFNVTSLKDIKENNKCVPTEKDSRNVKSGSHKEYKEERKKGNDIQKPCNQKILEEKHIVIDMKNLNKEWYDKCLNKKEECNKIHNNEIHNCHKDICNAVVSAQTLPLCDNVPHTSAVTKTPVTVKIPVVLTECSITITIESSNIIEDHVLEINHIRKNVYLNQCKLIPNSEGGEPNTGILFLDGFIRKNIEYSTDECANKVVSNGKLKHVTVKVPFKCTTRVTFKTPPKYSSNAIENEVELLETCVSPCDSCDEGISGKNIREKNFKLVEFFNEKVFCELISAEFIEADILEDPSSKENNKGCHILTEKVVLLLTIKLLQNQHVEIKS